MICRKWMIWAAAIGALACVVEVRAQNVQFPGGAPGTPYAQPPIGFGTPQPVYGQPAYGQPVYPSVTAPPVANPYPYGAPVVGSGVPAYYNQPAQPAFDPFYLAPGSTGGFEGGFQAAFLEAQVANTVSVPTLFANNGVPFTSAPVANYDFTFSPRFWAGVQFAGGFGLRGRYWHFDGSGNSDVIAGPTTPFFVGNTIPLTVGLNGAPNLAYDTVSFSNIQLNTQVKIDAIDFEFSQEGRLENWEFEVSGGVRYAQIRFNNTLSFNTNLIDTAFLPFVPLANQVIPVTSTTSSRFDGLGPTVDFFARRSLGFFEGVSFLMDARTTFLFGDTDVSSSATGAGGTALTAANSANLFATSRQPIQVWEIKVGVDYTFLFQNGGELHLGAFLEGQIWDWPLPVANAPGGDLGFVGPTAFIEYTH